MHRALNTERDYDTFIKDYEFKTNIFMEELFTIKPVTHSFDFMPTLSIVSV